VERLNEEELVEFFERRRGDMSLWSDTPSRVDTRRGGTVVFSVRFSRDELALLKGWAETQGRTLSELIRRAVLECATEGRSPYAVTIDRWFRAFGQSSYSLDVLDKTMARRARTVLRSPQPESGYVLVSSQDDLE
jgi:hypothetical protein